MTENRRNSRRAWLRGTVAAAAGLTVAVAMAGTASATPSQVTAPFAAQAEALGLSSAEAKALQGRADAYLAEEGGTQIAANKIRVTDGTTLVLALPNGRPAYGKDRSGTALASYTCRYGHFCAYSGINFTGDVIDMYQCAEYSMPWSGHGSWKNNQTTGTIANFESSDHVSRWHDGGAYSQDGDADWSGVWYVRNC
jgi:hypothetical protein